MSSQTIGFTSVTSNLFHAGYILMFNECKKWCDHLIVGIIVDSSDRPEKGESILTPFEKYIMVKNCKDVDEVIPLGGEKDLELALAGLQIDVRFVGTDYEHKDFTGKQVCQDRGIDIIYNNRLHELSSTKLIERAIKIMNRPVVQAGQTKSLIDYEALNNAPEPRTEMPCFGMTPDPARIGKNLASAAEAMAQAMGTAFRSPVPTLDEQLANTLNNPPNKEPLTGENNFLMEEGTYQGRKIRTVKDHC